MIDERFSFFDGLFIGQPNGKVTVIAVELAIIVNMSLFTPVLATYRFCTNGSLTAGTLGMATSASAGTF